MSWIKLLSFPNPEWTSSQIMKMNKNEFARFSSKKNETYAHKYNIINNKWDKSQFNLPKHTQFNNVTSALDEKAQILYIYTKQQVIKINLKTNESKITENVKNIGHSGRGIIINGKFHIIGGYGNREHLIWNGAKFESQFSFVESGYFCQSGIAYISSKASLLSIGGFHSGSGVNWIYLYDVTNRKWTKLTQTLPAASRLFGCVVSRDQKFVITLGGYFTNTIYVLNVETMKFRKSRIDCPQKGYFQAINMYDADNDELLTFGYIRNTWNYPQYKHALFPPFYIIKMISSYYSNEWIYLMEQDTGDHWKIAMDDILTN